MVTSIKAGSFVVTPATLLGWGSGGGGGCGEGWSPGGAPCDLSVTTVNRTDHL